MIGKQSRDVNDARFLCLDSHRLRFRFTSFRSMENKRKILIVRTISLCSILLVEANHFDSKVHGYSDTNHYDDALILFEIRKGNTLLIVCEATYEERYRTPS